MSMRRMIGAILAAMAVAGGATAQEGLRVALPAGFALAHAQENAAGMIREYIPAGQTLDAWREMVTVQRFAAGAGGDPVAYVDAVLGQLQQVCATPLATPVTPGQAPPYATATAVMGCEVSPRTGGPEIFALRAFAGREAVHVLQFAWARRPSDAELGAAMAVLAGAVLCDPARADAPCPGWGVLP
jgi:hypothetical protein